MSRVDAGVEGREVPVERPEDDQRRALKAPLVVVAGLCVVTAVLAGLLLAVVVTIADQVLTGSFSMLPDSGTPLRQRQPVPLAPLWVRISGVVLAVDLVLSVLSLLVLRQVPRFTRFSALAEGTTAWLLGTVGGVVLLVVVGLVTS